MNKQTNNERMGTMPIGKLLIEFSAPAIVGMVVMALYNIVDRIFLGQVSNEAIAAVYVTFPIMLIIMSVNMGVGIGGSSLASIRLGQGRKRDAEHIMGNSLLLLIVFSFLTAFILWFWLEPLLMLFGSSSTLLADAAAYQRIIIYGIPFQVIGFGMNSFIRSDGNPRAAMVTMLVGTIANIILDYVFIILWGWGVEGAAWATTIGQSLSWIWVFYYFVSKKSSLRVRVSEMMPDLYTIRAILALGFPPFAMQMAASLVMTIFNHELRFHGGDLAVAAMGVVQSISTLCFLPIFGINQGAQPLIGYNFGAKNYQRVKDTLHVAIKAGTIYMSLCFILIMIFPTQIIRVFVSDAASYEAILPMTLEGLRLYFLTVPILAYPIIGSIFFQATNKPVIATFLSLSRQVIILIPLVFVCAYLWGMTGIWIAYPASDILATTITAFFLQREMRKLNKLIKKQI